MSGRGGGGAAAGCGIFGLLGVLISVGLVFWLGSQALPDAPSSDGSTTDDPLTSVASAPGGAGPDTAVTGSLEVTLDPATGLGDATTVTVAVSGLVPGSSATITTCLAGGGAVVSGDRCDPAGEISATADGVGDLAAPYRPSRVVGADLASFDCATDAGTCVVQVTVTADPLVRGFAPIAFRPGLPGPALPGLPGD